MMKCLSTLIHSLNTYFTSFYFQNLKKQKYLFTSIVLRSSSYSTKIALKWTKIMLQKSVIPIWNPDNQGYMIGEAFKKNNDETYGKFHILGGGSAGGHFPYVITKDFKYTESYFEHF